MINGYAHTPVMPLETVQRLITDKNGIYIDATCGMAGHSLEILKNLNKNGKILAIEWDPEMVSIARKKTELHSKRIKIVQANFADMDEVAKRENISAVSGIIFDLGISSLHFDKSSRGFSFSRTGRLDMRINPSNPLDAYTIINKWPFEQIEHLIRVTGERNSVRISKAIVRERTRKEISTTSELKNLIEKILPHRKGHIHPATRTFLALRLAVNWELENLLKGIDNASKILKIGGRICIISFHSLEDKIVKETFRSMENLGGWRILTKKPITPREREIQLNYRSRSAKMRVIEKSKKEEGK